VSALPLIAELELNVPFSVTFSAKSAPVSTVPFDSTWRPKMSTVAPVVAAAVRLAIAA
jgi:hypothetical protein